MPALFIAGTGTDVGKTYISALYCRELKLKGEDIAYYKGAVSGADSVGASDAGFVRDFAGLKQQDHELLSYLYPEAISPHLAARRCGQRIDLEVIKRHFAKVQQQHQLVIMEGSGGLVCPLCWEEGSHLLLCQMIKALNLPVILVSHAGLGSINDAVQSAVFAAQQGLKVKGFILNNFKADDFMHQDNARMIAQISKVPVVAFAVPGARALQWQVPYSALGLFEA